MYLFSTVEEAFIGNIKLKHVYVYVKKLCSILKLKKMYSWFRDRSQYTYMSMWHVLKSSCVNMIMTSVRIWGSLGEGRASIE